MQRKKEEKTTELFRELGKTGGNPKAFRRFVRKHENDLIYRSLRDYFNAWLAVHQELSQTQIARTCGLSESYAHELLRGDKKNPGKYPVVQLCIAAHMDLEATNRALEIAQTGILYPKIPVDQAIIYCINSGYRSVMEVVGFMEENGLESPFLVKD